MALLRCLVVAVLALALAPATALGVDVQLRGPDRGHRRQRVGANSLEISKSGDRHVITATGASGTRSTPIAPRTRSTWWSVARREERHRTLDQGDDVFTDNGVPDAAQRRPREGTDRFTANGVSTPVSVAGGDDVDTITTGNGGDVLAGGDGNDTLDGRGGVDDYFGEGENDTIEARDGLAERISCGAGTDLARNDFTDIIAECETRRRRGRRRLRHRRRLQRRRRADLPGRGEIFENGVDEDCDGRDNVNLDRDGDGFTRPVDCDDGNAGIRPNAPEVRGNAVDENCDRRAAEFAAARHGGLEPLGGRAARSRCCARSSCATRRPGARSCCAARDAVARSTAHAAGRCGGTSRR